MAYGMTARQEAAHKLSGVVGKGRAEEMVQRALDEHAHELAEKIRKASVNWDEAADLIDPEVTT